MFYRFSCFMALWKILKPEDLFALKTASHSPCSSSRDDKLPSTDVQFYVWMFLL